MLIYITITTTLKKKHEKQKINASNLKSNEMKNRFFVVTSHSKDSLAGNRRFGDLICLLSPHSVQESNENVDDSFLRQYCARYGAFVKGVLDLICVNCVTQDVEVLYLWRVRTI